MTIPIIYFRSSSFNTHRFCPMQFFCEYTLGIRGPSNKKADKGTITHKILEICAVCKKAHQEGIDVIHDDIVGDVFTANYDPDYLSVIGSRVYQYYANHLTHHTWTDKDFQDCMSWVWKVLKYKDGMFDPMNRNVVDAEPHFDFIIKEEWAEYDYPDYGLKGHLAIKGTIDLITDVGDNTYEIIDWKTGRRLDWATGAEKDQNKLFTDPQLRIYHKAAKMMYPNVNTFLVTIFFINDGGAFTLHFTDNDLEYTNKILKDRFDKIRNTDEPKLIRHIDPKQGWKCRKLCHAGKTTFENTHIRPIVERRPGQYTVYGEVMSKCEQLRYMIKKYGIKWVIKNCSHPDHVIGKYTDPGSV